MGRKTTVLPAAAPKAAAGGTEGRRPAGASAISQPKPQNWKFADRVNRRGVRK